VNTHLPQGHEVGSLAKDLGDGVRLARLIEALAGKKVAIIEHPKTQIQVVLHLLLWYFIIFPLSLVAVFTM
jgi:hypothetical protein